MSKDETVVDATDAEQVISVEDLLSTDDLGVKYIALPAPWQGGIKARPLTMNEIAQVRKEGMQEVRNDQGKLVSVPNDKLSNIALIRASLVEPALTKDQVAALFQKNARLVVAILTALQVLNGIGDKPAAEVAKEAAATF